MFDVQTIALSGHKKIPSKPNIHKSIQATIS